MAQRYTELYRLPQALYAVGCPVIISVGVLQKDNETGKVLAQIKMQNIGVDTVIACKVSFKTFEPSGRELEGINEFSYLDIKAIQGQEFGAKTPVYMPDKNTRVFEVRIIEIVMQNGSIWSDNANWQPIPRFTPISDILKYDQQKLQYEIEVGKNCNYVPEIKDTLFLCSCGAVNIEGNSNICYNCHKSYKALTAALDPDMLNKKAEQRLKEQHEAEAARVAEADRKRRKNYLLAGIAALIITIGALTPTVFMPTIQYYSANKLVEKGEYDKAIKKYESIKGFMDSENKTLDAKYKKAAHLVETQHYDEAKELFTSLGDYKDASEQIGLTDKEQSYVNAVASYDAENYYIAFKLFDELGDYKDSAKRKADTEEMTYTAAVDALKNKDYENAIKSFRALGDYKDSTDQLKKSYAKKTQSLIAAAEVGDVVKFGKYEWYVISKTKSRARLLSKNAIWTKKYNNNFGSITWQKCSLRKFLNNDIYNDKFENYEKSIIVKTECKTKDNSTYKTKGGKTTKDYLFLLSIQEAKKLEDSIKKCDKNWWLRSPGQYQGRAMYVYGETISKAGLDVGRILGVRPALVVKLK